MHVGNEIVILWYHLQGEMCSETIAAQAPSQAIHHSCADCQLVVACALTCSHAHNTYSGVVVSNRLAMLLLVFASRRTHKV